MAPQRKNRTNKKRANQRVGGSKKRDSRRNRRQTRREKKERQERR